VAAQLAASQEGLRSVSERVTFDHVETKSILLDIRYASEIGSGDVDRFEFLREWIHCRDFSGAE
jgi:hypothetical protein